MVGIDKLGRRFGMIRMHSTSQYIGVATYHAARDRRMQQEVVNLMVADWASCWTPAGQPGDASRALSLSPRRFRDRCTVEAEIDRLCHPDAPAAAVEMIRQAGRGRAADRSGSQPFMRVSITWAARTDAKKKDPDDARRSVRADPRSAISSLEVASSLIHSPIISSLRLCAAASTLRREAAVEDVVSNKIDAVDWLDAVRPADQTSDTYFHDGACSRVWRQDEQALVGIPTERVLEKLIAGRPDAARKSP